MWAVIAETLGRWFLRLLDYRAAETGSSDVELWCGGVASSQVAPLAVVHETTAAAQSNGCCCRLHISMASKQILQLFKAVYDGNLSVVKSLHWDGLDLADSSFVIGEFLLLSVMRYYWWFMASLAVCIYTHHIVFCNFRYWLSSICCTHGCHQNISHVISNHAYTFTPISAPVISWTGAPAGSGPPRGRMVTGANV